MDSPPSLSNIPPKTVSSNGPTLEARNVTKSFGHVEALRGADLECRAGEVVALVGDNGAGKSTLVKILAGVLTADSGEILIAGERYAAGSAIASHVAGIETVYQDLALAPDLSPAANLFLGREIRRSRPLGWFGVLDEREMRKQAGIRFQELDVPVDADRSSVRTLSGGQRQGVAVARAVTWAKRIVLLDEPTAALGVVQTQNVLQVVRRVADSGLAVLFVSHSMPDVLAVADRIEVLRLGQRVARFTRAEATMEKLVGAMTGALTFSTDQPGQALT